MIGKQAWLTDYRGNEKHFSVHQLLPSPRTKADRDQNETTLSLSRHHQYDRRANASTEAWRTALLDRSYPRCDSAMFMAARKRKWTVPIIIIKGGLKGREPV